MSSEADSFGRDRSRRRRDSSSSTTTTSRSRLCSRPDHARSTHRHASSRSRQARSSFSHEKRKYHDERSGKAVQYERESDYDDRSSRLKRVEVRLKRVDVDNPVDRDDHDHDDLANLLARLKRVEVRLKRVDIDTSPDRPKRLRKPNKKYSSTEYDLSGLDGGIEQVDDVYVVWTFPSFYDEVGTEYDLSLVE